MENIRVRDGQKILLKGYLYITEDPVENSELIGNPERAIQNKALQLFSIKDLNLIWTEIHKRELVK